MSDEAKQLISEAKAQARKENLKNFFLKNQKQINRLGILFIVILIAYIAFGAFQSAQKSKYSSMLHQALIDEQIGNFSKSKEALKNIFESTYVPNQIKALAGLRYGAILLQEKKNAEAAKTYQEIAKCFSCDEYLRNLAALLAVKTWMSDAEEIKLENLSSRIEKLENSATILRTQISEQRAILELQKNNLEKSYQIFELISKSEDVSQDLKERSQDYMNIIVSKGFKKEEKQNSKTK